MVIDGQDSSVLHKIIICFYTIRFRPLVLMTYVLWRKDAVYFLCTGLPHYNSPHYNTDFNITRSGLGFQMIIFLLC